MDTNFLYVCPSCSSGACFCACLWGNLRSVNYVLGVCADLQDFLTHKNTVWVKQYGMLMSMCVVVFWNWKQIYVVFGISSVKVILNKLAHFSKTYSLSDPGDSRPVVSRHTELAQNRHSDHFLHLHDITNFRFQWRRADIQLLWLIVSYRALASVSVWKK